MYISMYVRVSVMSHIHVYPPLLIYIFALLSIFCLMLSFYFSKESEKNQPRGGEWQQWEFDNDITLLLPKQMMKKEKSLDGGKLLQVEPAAAHGEQIQKMPYTPRRQVVAPFPLLFRFAWCLKLIYLHAVDSHSLSLSLSGNKLISLAVSVHWETLK